MKRLLLLLSFVLLFLGLIVFRGFQSRRIGGGGPEEKALPVAASRLESRTFLERVTFVATLEPEESAAVVAKLPGRTVLSVSADLGDAVEAGQVLAQLDDSLLRSGLAQAEAAEAAAASALYQARVEEETAFLDYGRYRNLYDEEVISRQAYDHAKGRYEAARAGREMAEKGLAQAREAKAELLTQMGYHRLTAPVSGVVAGRFIDAGDSSSVNDPAFIIHRQGRVRVRGSLPEVAFLRVSIGQKADIAVDALPGRAFQGRVSRLAPALDEMTRTGDVEILLDNDGSLKPGLFARVALLLGERQGLALPREALFSVEGTGERACYVVDDDGRARIRIVKTGLDEGNWVEIVDGLGDGETVVVTRSGALEDGRLLEVSGR